MEGLIALWLFWRWLKTGGKEEIEQAKANKDMFGRLPNDSSREDYMRANSRRSERFPNGNRQDGYGR